MSKVIFNGYDLNDYGIYTTGSAAFNAPEREYLSVSVPGRSGDVFIPTGKFNNITVAYPAIITRDFKSVASDLRNILLSTEGYAKLEDDYNTDEFRMAVFAGPLEIASLMFQAGGASLSFNCQPERWLKSGFTPRTIPVKTTRTINNPTLFQSKPLIYFTNNTQTTTDVVITFNGIEYTFNSEGEENN